MRFLVQLAEIRTGCHAERGGFESLHPLQTAVSGGLCLEVRQRESPMSPKRCLGLGRLCRSSLNAPGAEATEDVVRVAHASAQRSDKPQDRARAKPRRKADHFAELWSPRPWPSRRVKRRRAECAADRWLKWSSIYDHVAPAIEGQVQLPPGMSPPGSSAHGAPAIEAPVGALLTSGITLRSTQVEGRGSFLRSVIPPEVIVPVCSKGGHCSPLVMDSVASRPLIRPF
jgi:hypothetical protein